jgi:hypothetical protein
LLIPQNFTAGLCYFGRFEPTLDEWGFAIANDYKEMEDQCLKDFRFRSTLLQCLKDTRRGASFLLDKGIPLAKVNDVISLALRKCSCPWTHLPENGGQSMIQRVQSMPMPINPMASSLPPEALQHVQLHTLIGANSRQNH